MLLISLALISFLCVSSSFCRVSQSLSQTFFYPGSAFVRPRTPQGQKTTVQSPVRSPQKTAIEPADTEQAGGDSGAEDGVEDGEGDAQMDEAEESGEESEGESMEEEEEVGDRNKMGDVADDRDEPGDAVVEEGEVQDRDEDEDGVEDEDDAEDEELVEDSYPADEDDDVDNQLEALSPNKRKLGVQTPVSRKRSSAVDTSPAGKRRVSHHNRTGSRRTSAAPSRAGYSRHEDKENLSSEGSNHESEASVEVSQRRASKHSSMRRNTSRVSATSGGHGDADDSVFADKTLRRPGEVSSHVRSGRFLSRSGGKPARSSEKDTSDLTTEPNEDLPQYKDSPHAVNRRKRQSKR